MDGTDNLEAIEVGDLATLDTEWDELPQERTTARILEAHTGAHGTGNEHWTGMASVDAIRQLRILVLLSPFVPGVREQLKKIANKYKVLSWYTYPGKPMDLFTRHRGRLHKSKCRNCIYISRLLFLWAPVRWRNQP